MSQVTETIVTNNAPNEAAHTNADEDFYLEFDNLPNRLTLFRIALIPIVVSLLFLADDPWENLVPYRSYLNWGATWLFTIASLTDFLDGYIARKRKIVTVFGSFLDPIADKFLVVSGLITLQAIDRVPAWIVIILVLREMYMTSLRLLANDEGINVPVNSIGKWKTGFQMTAMPMLMCHESWWIFPFPQIGTGLIYVASVLSLYSATVYSIDMLRKLKIKRSMQKKKNKLNKKKKFLTKMLNSRKLTMKRAETDKESL